MAFPLMLIATLAPTIIKSLSGLAASAGLIDDEKAEEIYKIAGLALGGVGYAIDAFKAIRDKFGEDAEWTPEMFDDLIAEIRANSARIDELTKPPTA